jgi:multidrug efflux system membrane fusion protein
MIMKKSTYLSLGLFFLVAIWMLSGVLFKPSKSEISATNSVTHSTPRSPQKMTVGVEDIRSQNIMREIMVQGELEPLRKVEIRAQTTSRVVELPVEKGEPVAEGTLLVRLAKEDREAQLKSAQAEVESQQLEVAGAKKLLKRGLQSKNQLKARESALALAEAALERAKLELEYIAIKTPFQGVLEERYVELGSHLEKGDQVALIVDKSIVKAVGYISQQSTGKVRLGQKVNIRLLDGQEASGTLTYLSSVGDAQTHSFRVEADVVNTDGMLNAGVSVELSIATGQESAHFVSPAVLSLDAHGEIGIKSVNGDSVVSFYPIELLRTEAGGIWVSGLPDKVRIITQGQGFVNEGEPVKEMPAS